MLIVKYRNKVIRGLNRCISPFPSLFLFISPFPSFLFLFFFLYTPFSLLLYLSGVSITTTFLLNGQPLPRSKEGNYVRSATTIPLLRAKPQIASTNHAGDSRRVVRDIHLHQWPSPPAFTGIKTVPTMLLFCSSLSTSRHDIPPLASERELSLATPSHVRPTTPRLGKGEKRRPTFLRRESDRKIPTYLMQIF